MRSTRTLSLAGAAIAAGGIGLFAWLIAQAGPREVWQSTREIGWGLVPIVLVGGLRFVARAMAWMRCMEPPHTLRLPVAVAAVLSGDALGNATPLGPLVGEPAKVAFVRSRVPLRVAFTALAVENLFYTLSVAAILAAGTLALLLHAHVEGDVRAAATAAIGAMLGIYVVAAWALWRKPALLSSSVAIVGRLLRSAALQGRLEKVRRLEQDIYTFASRRRHAVGPLVATELAFHVLGVLEIHLTLRLLTGDWPSVVTSFIFETANRLITVVFKFVPGQPGLNEGGTVVMAQLLGLPAHLGLMLGIVRRVRVLFWQLAGMSLLVREGVTTRRILADPELTGGSSRLS